MPRTSKLLCALTTTLFATSCVVPPGCVSRTFGKPSPKKALVVITLYSEPVKEPPPQPYPNGFSMAPLFARGAAIRLDADGTMTVSALNMWPESCRTISREDLARVARSWQPFLDQVTTARTDIRALANPRLGDDWRPDGPVLSLSFGSTSERLVQLLWDGRSRLPPELESAVIGTLKTMCSNSRRAKKYLLRDLPQQVAGRLDCQSSLGGTTREDPGVGPWGPPRPSLRRSSDPVAPSPPKIRRSRIVRPLVAAAPGRR
jgi:hypothetical protein